MDDLSAIYEWLRNKSQVYSNYNCGIQYDPIVDTIYIPSEQSDLFISLFCGGQENLSQELVGSLNRIMAHENQHIFDLGCSFSGIKNLHDLLAISEGIQSPTTPPEEVVSKIKNYHFRSDQKTELGRYYINNTKNFASPNRGFDSEIGFEWKTSSSNERLKNVFAAIALYAMGSNGERTSDKLLHHIGVSENSIYELSALSAEFSQAMVQDASEKNIISLEKQLYMLMHDFTKPEYIGGLHAAHIALRPCRLLDSLFFGGLIAHISIMIAETGLARTQKISPFLSQILEGTPDEADFTKRADLIFVNFLLKFLFHPQHASLADNIRFGPDVTKKILKLLNDSIQLPDLDEVYFVNHQEIGQLFEQTRLSSFQLEIFEQAVEKSTRHLMDRELSLREPQSFIHFNYLVSNVYSPISIHSPITLLVHPTEWKYIFSNGDNLEQLKMKLVFFQQLRASIDSI